MAKPTEAEIIKALEAAKRSLDDGKDMCVSDEMPTLYEDSHLVNDVLKRLRGW